MRRLPPRTGRPKSLSREHFPWFGPALGGHHSAFRSFPEPLRCTVVTFSSSVLFCIDEMFDFSFDIASKATDTSVVRGIMCVSIAGFSCDNAIVLFIVESVVDIIVNLFLLLLGIDLGLLLGIDQGLLKDLCLLLLLQMCLCLISRLLCCVGV